MLSLKETWISEDRNCNVESRCSSNNNKVYYWATMDTSQRDVIQQHRKPIFVGFTLCIFCARHVTVSTKIPKKADT